ncbi:ABC transporter ATP-binding protein [Nesterenkonia alkaliphila]|uniref:ATP-binding cassette domain-containing protein n=1 Tax=Nesterenkonia alkaliphila TaxID=1463631 RepID=A0A7K1UHU7_9MICC|nr:ABC transporter ATP-binding protein [Nesterenkonia alkaliphila]MVT26038.1 ATP-binding cassette domain-containing protein [Nesterenkonia alkaliphila]GFZ86270.1 ABC transporter [Nesterenkonia alkaliphila]
MQQSEQKPGAGSQSQPESPIGAQQRAAQQRVESGERRTLAQAFGRLVPYLQGLKLRWLLGVFAAIGAGVIALSIPVVLGRLVDDIEAIDAVGAVVWTAFAVVLCLGVLEAVFVFLRRFFVIPPASDAEMNMRVSLFDRLVHQTASFHGAWEAGQLQSRAIADLNMLRRFFAFGSLMLLTSCITVTVGIAVMFTWSPLLAGLFLCAAVPVIVLGPAFRRKFIHYSRSAQDQAGEVATKVEESVHGIRVLKAFGRGDWARSSFKEEAATLRDLEVSKMRTLAKFQMLMVLLPESVLAACIFTGLYLAAQGDMTAGALAGFFSMAVVLKQPIEGIGMLIGMVFMAKTSIDRHIDVMDIEPEIASPTEPRTTQERGLVELDNVHFRYPDAAEDLIRGATLRIEPGETMALVSATGGGTSTLLNLVPRLYDVTGGSVRIDGVDVREYSLPDLRSRVAVAFEDPTLFSTTVKSNVLLGTGHHRDEDDPAHPYREKSPRPDQLEQVLAEALHTADAEFAANLPEGLDTRIGEEGLSLSGGQRQRLALSRAIAAKPSVLLLDDPLSALDVRTEERVTDRLRRVLQGTTTLIVAHRPSTVAMADRVALLHEGRIADVGTHTELLTRSETYAKIMKPPAPGGQELMDTVAAAGSEPGTEQDAIAAEEPEEVRS